jgi:hypothetical protein
LYFVALIVIVAVYYLFLLSNGTFQILALELLDKIFDNPASVFIGFGAGRISNLAAWRCYESH